MHAAYTMVIQGKMLTSVTKSVLQGNVRSYCSLMVRKSEGWMKIERCNAHMNEPYMISNQNLMLFRRYCTEPKTSPTVTLPMLMHDDNPMTETLPLSKYLPLVKGIMDLRMLDKDLDPVKMLEGFMHAMFVISDALRRRDYEFLEGVVTNAVIEQLKVSIEKLTDEQRALLPITEDNMYKMCVNEMNVTPGTMEGQNWVTTKVFCLLKHNGNKTSFYIPLNEYIFPQKSKHVIVCNYGFIREYTHGNKGPWIANWVNQFSLVSS